MTVACSNCGHQLNLDESRIPSGPFKVKCSHCGQVSLLRGPVVSPARQSGEVLRSESVKPAPPASSSDTPVPAKQSEQSPGGSSPLQNVEQLIEPYLESKIEKITKRFVDAFSGLLNETTARLDLGIKSRLSSSDKTALICESDQHFQRKIAEALQRLGYAIEIMGVSEDLIARLSSNVYPLIVVSQEVEDAKSSCDKILERVNSQIPEQRRQTFLVLLSSSLKTTRASGAFMNGANLVINKADFGSFENLLLEGQKDFAKLYKTYNDALV